MAFVGIYRALYDYAPQSSEELEITDGDLLFVLEKSTDDDWWKCKKKAASEDDDEPEGLVPNNYVEEAKATHQAKALYDYTKQTDEELSLQENETVDIFDETDPDWTLVGRNRGYGFVPAIYIEPLPAGGAPVAREVSPAPPPMPPRPAAADDGPIPGEEDYVPPSPPGRAAGGPAEQLANILAQKTGSADAEATPAPPAAARTLAAPPPAAARAQYTPEESEEEEPPPPKPARPQSQSIPSPPVVQSPVRSPKRSESQYVSSGTAEAPGILPSPTHSESGAPRSPGGYHLYNIHEMISHMGKSKKLPMTLGINVLRGTVMISPEKSRDGPSQEWTAEKLQHYSIEGKHVFVELVRPSRSVDFHAGAKDTAQEIVAHLGELAGAARAEGLREVWAASTGSGQKKGQMLYEFMAQGEDEVTVSVGDEVIVLDDSKSDEWWMVRRLKNGKEGVVPSSYVEITGTVPKEESRSGLNAGRSTVEQNRIEEERLAKEAAKNGTNIPTRGSSLAGPGASSSSRRHQSKRSSGGAGGSKSKPNSSRVRTWTDRSGTFKVDAEFIGLREGKIHLHKINGVKIAVPVAKMAVEDLEYVEQATGASLDEDKPLSDIKRRSTQRQVKKAASGAGATVVPKDQDYWFEFFLGCGVNPQICDRYASAFSRDQMGPEVLPEVNEQLLRTLGLKEGDILRVMKFLDNKYNRKGTPTGGAAGAVAGDDDKIEPANGGGLFSGPGGALRNNTKKGRPAPAVQTNDVVSEDAFRSKDASASASPVKSPAGGEGAKRTALADVPAREPKTGFEDDAWDVKPARTATPDAAPRKVEESLAPKAPESKLVNDDIASLSITSPPLQPTTAPASTPAPAPAQSPPPAADQQQPQGANKEIFDKIAALAPARQRPQPPPQQQHQQQGGALGVPPPPRASSAPGFQPQQSQFGNVAPLQAQLTGYNPQHQYQQGQQTGYQPPQGYGQPNGPNGFMPHPTGLQAMQQNYPSLLPQPTGLNFQPQSQFGQSAQAQHYGQQMPQQTGFQPQQQQQQYINGNQPSASPFADPPRQPYQPGVSSGLQNSFGPQQTGYQPQQQPQFNISQPTGMNGYQQQQQGGPNLPPQQTGGVFGPSQPATGAPAAPLMPQKTGPTPPVRFGVKPGDAKLMPQLTGRANLAKASKYFLYFDDDQCGWMWGCVLTFWLQRRRIRSGFSCRESEVGFWAWFLDCWSISEPACFDSVEYDVVQTKTVCRLSCLD